MALPCESTGEMTVCDVKPGERTFDCVDRREEGAGSCIEAPASATCEDSESLLPAADDELEKAVPIPLCKTGLCNPELSSE